MSPGAAPARPRVLHLIPTLFDPAGRLIGGAERYVFELARHMAEIVPTTLVSFGKRSEESLVGGLRIRIVEGAWHVRGQEGNPMHPALLRAMLGADVVHCHQTHVLMSSLAALFGRMTRKAVFTTDLGGGGWDVSAYLPTDGWYHGHLHISDYSRRVYGHAERENARVILGGVDASKFLPPEGTSERSYVLFVGRLLPHKGLDDLIRGVPPGLPLVVVGHVHDPGYLESLKRLSEGKSVEFRHDVTDSELVELYGSALCVVLPSVYRAAGGGETLVPELLGQTLLEAMACGTPAICTDVGSMPEIVRDHVTGFIVPPNAPDRIRDAIDFFRSKPLEREKMGRAGRSDVLERFSWPSVVDRCLEAYEAAAR